jgi:hypothetical protein
MAGAHQSYLNNVQKILVFILPAFAFNRKKVRINVSGICQLSRDKFLPYFLVYIINLLMQTYFYGMFHHSVDAYPFSLFISPYFASGFIFLEKLFRYLKI